MTYGVFQTILNAGIKAGTEEMSTNQARDWFRQKAATVKVTPSSVISTATNKTTSIENIIGSMVLFSYDPKTKATLPFYDRYPLIFITGVLPDGFTGINFHYLPLTYRAILMDGLYQIALDEPNPTKPTYELLRSYARLRYYKPCFKRYLNTYVRSNFAIIDKSDWDKALFLPLDRFKKAGRELVHIDSIQKIVYG
jgi:hypothetical protein